MLYRSLYRFLTCSLILASAFHTVSAQAIPFNPAININATVSLDTTNSTVSSGGASQSGGLAVTTAGVPTASTFNELTVSGSNPIAQALTNIGDSLAINFLVGGTFANGPAENSALFGDYTLVLNNSSLTDTFEIVLGVSVAQLLSAAGADSFVIGELRIEDALNNLIVFANHTRDTLNGDSDSPLSPASFSVFLAPGQTIQYDGLLSLRGGAFDGSYSGGMGAQISVAGVRNVTITPEPVPEPGTYLLIAIGLGALVARRLRV